MISLEVWRLIGAFALAILSRFMIPDPRAEVVADAIAVLLAARNTALVREWRRGRRPDVAASSAGAARHSRTGTKRNEAIPSASSRGT